MEESAIPVQSEGRTAEVVPVLAPLMLAAWKLDVDALHAEMEEDKHVYLYLAEQGDVELFYAFLDFEEGSDVFKRSMGGPDADCWTIVTFPVDLRKEKLEEGEHPFGLSFCVQFPASDLDQVLRHLSTAAAPCGDCEGCKADPAPDPRQSN